MPLRYRFNCFTARLLSVVGLRTCVGSCWKANCMSGLQGAIKMSFPTVCPSWSDHDHPEELLTRAPSLSSVYQDWLSVSSFPTCKRFEKRIPRGLYCFFHLEAPACIGDLKTSKVYCVAFMTQHHHICQTQTGLHVFNIGHEMFIWSRAHHILHVTQEDRIDRSFCAFLQIRRRISDQLVVAHVVDFLCAVNTLKSFLAKPYLGRVQLCFRCRLHIHWF